MAKPTLKTLVHAVISGDEAKTAAANCSQGRSTLYLRDPTRAQRDVFVHRPRDRSALKIIFGCFAFTKFRDTFSVPIQKQK